MSTLFHNSTMVPRIPVGRRRTLGPQFYSYPTWLRPLLLWIGRSRQREALRALADNKHLLDDIGLSRREALGEADRPFWE
jgi:uncharacterized protein YjiS (DUF1127 family)